MASPLPVDHSKRRAVPLLLVSGLFERVPSAASGQYGPAAIIEDS